MRKILLSHDPAEGTPPGDTPPPAATTVLESDAREGDAAEMVKLRRDREELAAKVKARETRVSELEDENRRLKTPPAAPVAAAQKKGWLDGATFLG